MTVPGTPMLAFTSHANPGLPPPPPLYVVLPLAEVPDAPTISIRLELLFQSGGSVKDVIPANKAFWHWPPGAEVHPALQFAASPGVATKRLKATTIHLTMATCP